MITKFNMLFLLLACHLFLGSCRYTKQAQIKTGTHGLPMQPNFIVIYTDDQRFDGLGANNNPIIKTPNIDKMARRSLQFSNANVAFSLCSPSRAALLTGRYGSKNGVLELGSGLNKGEVTIAALLKERGYATALNGKWHIAQSPLEMGFEHYSYFFGNGDYYNRRTIDQTDTIYPKEHVDLFSVNKSIDFLKKQVENDTPFFLFHCPQLPHMNGDLIWDAKDSTKAMYKVSDMPVVTTRDEDLNNKPAYLKTVRNLTQAKKYGYPDSLAIQEHTRDYYAVITEMDEFLGKLFKNIEDLGLLKNTYVIFMSDNGWMLGDHGFTSKILPYRPSTHVPFWIIGPTIKAGDNDSMVSNLDILPTILDLAKIEIPKNVQGRSLFSILNGTETKVRDYFIYEGVGFYGGNLPNITVITKDFRYIQTYATKALKQVIFEELYDQNDDYLEVNNLSLNTDYKETIRAMQKKINLFILGK